MTLSIIIFKMWGWEERYIKQIIRSRGVSKRKEGENKGIYRNFKERR